MKNFTMVLVVLTISFFTFSCDRSSERNALSFKDKFKDVQDSLAKMERLLSKLPQRNDNRNRNYVLQEDELLLNGIPIEEFTFTTHKLSNIYTTKEIQEILSIANYLNKNFVSGAYFDEVDGLWRFTYKPVSNSNYDSIRDIYLSHSSKLLTTSNDTILEHKAQLYLLAPNDAKIQ